MKVDRKIAPVSKSLSDFSYLRAEKYCLDNSIPLYFINQSEQEIVKVEFMFEAGSAFQHKPLVASSVANLLKEGTTQHTAKQLADLIENQGVFLETECAADTASIAFYSLTKNLTTVLPLIKEILFEAVLSQKEVDNYLQNKKQKFLVNNEKVDFLAKNKFIPFLFGEKHTYNAHIESKNFEEIRRDDLLDFYHKRFVKRSY